MNNIVDTPHGHAERLPDVPVRVVIIEDLREVREGLAMLIDGTTGFECAPAIGRWRTRSRASAGSRPDVILTDIGLPGHGRHRGHAAFCASAFPQVPILALTVYDDDEKVFNAICAGASGYLLKNTPPARLLESLTRSGGRRRADVAGGRAPRRHAVPRVPSAGSAPRII